MKEKIKDYVVSSNIQKTKGKARKGNRNAVRLEDTK